MWDCPSPEVSGSCTIVPTKLIKPPQGRPGQLRSGRRPSDRSMWHHNARLAGKTVVRLIEEVITYFWMTYLSPNTCWIKWNCAF